MSKDSKKTQFTDILQYYKNGNSPKAFQMLKTANISQEDAGLAKQLKAEIVTFLAVEKINNYEFKEAIAIIEPNLQLQPKQGFPLPIEQTKIILGISFLYLADFDKAISYLSFAQKSTEHHAFCFYLLLAQLYKNGGNALNFNEFKSQNLESFENLPETKIKYIEAVNYLLQENYAQYKQLISEIQTESFYQKQNVEFLQVFLSNSKNSNSTTHLKPLYKFLAEIDLLPNEKNYLANFAVIKESLEKSAKVENIGSLHQKVNDLCFHGTAMDLSSFQSTIKKEEFLPYKHLIVYNQLNALYENKEFADFKKIFIGFQNDFLTVPESISLYLNAVYELNTQLFGFFAVINTYLETHARNLSKKQIELIVFEVIDKLIYFDSWGNKKKCDEELFKLKTGEQKIDCISFYLFMDYCLDKNKKLSNDIIKLWESETIVFLGEEYLKILKSTVREFDKLDFDPFSIFGRAKKGIKNNSILYYNRVIEVFSQNFTPHRNAKNILEFYHFFNSCIYENLENFETINLDNYTTNYLKFIEFYKLGKNSIYYLDYLKIKNFKYFGGLEGLDIENLADEIVKLIKENKKDIVYCFLNSEKEHLPIADKSVAILLAFERTNSKDEKTDVPLILDNIYEKPICECIIVNILGRLLRDYWDEKHCGLIISVFSYFKKQIFESYEEPEIIDLFELFLNFCNKHSKNKEILAHIGLINEIIEKFQSGFKFKKKHVKLIVAINTSRYLFKLKFLNIIEPVSKKNKKSTKNDQQFKLF